MVARVIGIMANKGGVLKTASATSLSGALLRLKGSKEQPLKILVIDTDNQGNASQAFNIEDPDIFDVSLYEVLLEGAPVNTAIKRVFKDENLGEIHLLPSNSSMTTFEIAILEEYYRNGIQPFPDAYNRLREKVGYLAEYYDYIIIDTPPHIGITGGNVLNFTIGMDSPVEVLIPFEPGKFSERSLKKMYENVEGFLHRQGSNVKILGAFPTKVKATASKQDIRLQNVRRFCAEKDIQCYLTSIPESTQYDNYVEVAGVPITLADLIIKKKPEKYMQKLIQSYYDLVEEAGL